MRFRYLFFIKHSIKAIARFRLWSSARIVETKAAKTSNLKDCSSQPNCQRPAAPRSCVVWSGKLTSAKIRVISLPSTTLVASLLFLTHTSLISGRLEQALYNPWRSPLGETLGFSINKSNIQDRIWRFHQRPNGPLLLNDHLFLKESSISLLLKTQTSQKILQFFGILAGILWP